MIFSSATSRATSSACACSEHYVWHRCTHILHVYKHRLHNTNVSYKYASIFRMYIVRSRYLDNAVNSVNCVDGNFEGNYGVGIVVNSGAMVRLEGNEFESQGGPGIIVNSVSALTVRSNYFVRNNCALRMLLCCYRAACARTALSRYSVRCVRQCSGGQQPRFSTWKCFESPFVCRSPQRCTGAGLHRHPTQRIPDLGPGAIEWQESTGCGRPRRQARVCSDPPIQRAAMQRRSDCRKLPLTWARLLPW